MSVTVVSPAETAEPIKMPFGSWALVGSRTHALDGVQIPVEKGQFSGEGLPIVKYYRDCLPFAVQKRLNRSIEMSFGMLIRVDLKEPRIRWGSDPHGKGMPRYVR